MLFQRKKKKKALSFNSRDRKTTLNYNFEWTTSCLFPPLLSEEYYLSYLSDIQCFSGHPSELHEKVINKYIYINNQNTTSIHLHTHTLKGKTLKNKIIAEYSDTDLSFFPHTKREWMNTSKVTTASFYFHAKLFPFCISQNFEAFDAFCATNAKTEVPKCYNPLRYTM